jgi:hypothetical protein
MFLSPFLRLPITGLWLYLREEDVRIGDVIAEFHPVDVVYMVFGGSALVHRIDERRELRIHLIDDSWNSIFLPIDGIRLIAPHSWAQVNYDDYAFPWHGFISIDRYCLLEPTFPLCEYR